MLFQTAIITQIQFFSFSLVPALVLMEQPMERTAERFTNMLAEGFSLLLMHKTTAESLIDSFYCEHHLIATQETWVEAPCCYPGL